MPRWDLPRLTRPRSPCLPPTRRPDHATTVWRRQTSAGRTARTKPVPPGQRRPYHASRCDASLGSGCHASLTPPCQPRLRRPRRTMPGRRCHTRRSYASHASRTLAICHLILHPSPYHTGPARPNVTDACRAMRCQPRQPHRTAQDRALTGPTLPLPHAPLLAGPAAPSSPWGTTHYLCCPCRAFHAGPDVPCPCSGRQSQHRLAVDRAMPCRPSHDAPCRVTAPPVPATPWPGPTAPAYRTPAPP